MPQFIELDLSLRDTAVSVVDERGAKIWTGKTLSDPDSILHSIKPWANDIELIGLEACPLSEWIFAGLRDLAQNVRCIETRHAQRFLSTRPNKTDRNDAEGIAQMMCLCHFKPVHVKSRTSQGIQTIVAARAHLLLAASSRSLGISSAVADAFRLPKECALPSRMIPTCASPSIRSLNPARCCGSRNLATTAHSMHCQRTIAFAGR